MMSYIIVALAATMTAGDFYMYPEAYEHGDGLGASVNEEAVAELLRMHSYGIRRNDGSRMLSIALI